MLHYCTDETAVLDVVLVGKEPAEFVYQVKLGAVRSYKLLSDGRRQIGAFHLVDDIFG
jgi:CRP-like cAMP-binding protein